jgi:hypothetical protein
LRCDARQLRSNLGDGYGLNLPKQQHCGKFHLESALCFEGILLPKNYPSVLMGATRLDVKPSADPFAYTVCAEFPLLAHRDKLAAARTCSL